MSTHGFLNAAFVIEIDFWIMGVMIIANYIYLKFAFGFIIVIDKFMKMRMMMITKECLISKGQVDFSQFNR